MDTDAVSFRVLLAEDDPVSAEFLAAALRACGAEVTTCNDGQAAVALARSKPWDLLLLDQHLPGLTGAAIVAALRTGPGHSSLRPPAIAITAAADEDSRSLLRAGFSEVLAKPISVTDLRDALQRHGCPVVSALDDEAAVRACGSVAAVERLRHLFAERELPAVLAEVDGNAGDPQNLRPTLHRLRASCGFCGTWTLARATATLHGALASRADEKDVRSALAAFRTAVVETQAALHVSFNADA